MEQQNGNGIAINGTAVKWNNNNKMEQQSVRIYETTTITCMYMFYINIVI